MLMSPADGRTQQNAHRMPEVCSLLEQHTWSCWIVSTIYFLVSFSRICSFSWAITIPLNLHWYCCTQADDSRQGHHSNALSCYNSQPFTHGRFANVPCETLMSLYHILHVEGTPEVMVITKSILSCKIVVTLICI